MNHPSIKSVTWVPHNEHDELVRAMAQIDQLQAVVDAAVVFVHAEQMAALGHYSHQLKKAHINLQDEVAAFEEWEQDL